MLLISDVDCGRALPIQTSVEDGITFCLWKGKKSFDFPFFVSMTRKESNCPSKTSIVPFYALKRSESSRRIKPSATLGRISRIHRKSSFLPFSFVFDLSRGTWPANPVRAGRWRQKWGKRYFCRPQNIFPAKFCVSWEYFLASPIAHSSICENDVAKASNDETKSPAIDCPPERKNWIEFPRAPGISASLSHDERISKIPSGIELLLAYEQSHKVSILAVISFQISNAKWEFDMWSMLSKAWTRQRCVNDAK